MSLDKLRRETEWRCKAACWPSVCALGWEAFMPTVGAYDTYDPGPALLVCGPCPTKAECDADCERNNFWYGVWGGKYHGRQVEKLTRWGPFMRVEGQSREPYVA